MKVKLYERKIKTKYLNIQLDEVLLERIKCKIAQVGLIWPSIIWVYINGFWKKALVHIKGATGHVISDGNMLIYILVYGWNHSVIFHSFINPDFNGYESYFRSNWKIRSRIWEFPPVFFLFSAALWDIRLKLFSSLWFNTNKMKGLTCFKRIMIDNQVIC